MSDLGSQERQRNSYQHLLWELDRICRGQTTTTSQTDPISEQWQKACGAEARRRDARIERKSSSNKQLVEQLLDEIAKLTAQLQAADRTITSLERQITGHSSQSTVAVEASGS